MNNITTTDIQDWLKLHKPHYFSENMFLYFEYKENKLYTIQPSLNINDPCLLIVTRQKGVKDYGKVLLILYKIWICFLNTINNNNGYNTNLYNYTPKQDYLTLFERLIIKCIENYKELDFDFMEWFSKQLEKLDNNLNITSLFQQLFKSNFFNPTSSIKIFQFLFNEDDINNEFFEDLGFDVLWKNWGYGINPLIDHYGNRYVIDCFKES